jgi:hypothetical protein
MDRREQDTDPKRDLRFKVGLDKYVDIISLLRSVHLLAMACLIRESVHYSFTSLFFFACICNTLCPQKLALTSPISGGRSVCIVRLWTKATEFS